MSDRESGNISAKWTTRDILYIIVFSIIGALYSTFFHIGEFLVVAMPTFPAAGWLVAGINGMFVLLSFGLTLKKFSGTAAGAVKGVFELLFGNVRIGVLIVVQDIIVGLLIDIMYFIFLKLDKEKAKNDEGRLSWLLPWTLGAGIGNALTLPIFFAALGMFDNPLVKQYIGVVLVIAVITGAIYGALARVIREVIIKAGVPSPLIREK